jgi:hypothetical protein
MAVLAVGIWQLLTVHYNYGGNDTALFCIAPHMPVPEFLKSERLYIFQNSGGFDGQIFHLIAHDPWMTKGSAAAILSPAFRYQRILVPALAWMLALGRDQRVHAAYYTVILGCVFLGVYWLAQFAGQAGFHPAWGLAFAVTPSALTGIDRMTVDVALAALSVGFALYAETGPRWKIVALLTLAALTKEQAFPIIAGYVLYLFTRRRFADGVWAAAAVLPALAWFGFMAMKQPDERTLIAASVDWVPFAGMVDALLHPMEYALPPFRMAAAVVFDYVALVGFGLALAIVVRLAIERRWNCMTAPIYVVALTAIFLRNKLIWTDAYNFGRGFTPFLLLLAFQSLGRPWLAVLPLLLIDARAGMNLVPQILGVARGLVGL